MDVARMNLFDLRRVLDAGEISAVELTSLFLDRITQLNPELNAFITVTGEEALHSAKEADTRLASGEGITPLTGIPIAVKDNICTQGVRTTCGSKLLENYLPAYDATVITKLKKAGAVLIGKTNLDEFAMGSSTEDSGYGLTLNPWDRQRVAGGSSGGSAAAVAAGMAPLALGSDTGGSIRQPSAFCGILGLKPTYGRVSRLGLVPYAPSLDQIGSMARRVRDLIILDHYISTYDPLDSTSLPEPPPEIGDFPRKLPGLRIGLPKEYFEEDLKPQIKERVHTVAQVLEKEGCVLVELSLPSLQYAVATYYILAWAEASSSMARYDGVRYGYRATGEQDVLNMMMETRKQGFGAEVKRRILMGTCFLTEGYYEDYYRKAQKIRALIKKDFEMAFTKCDLLLTPTTTVTAFKIGENFTDSLILTPTERCTVAANLTGIPGLSFPCGLIEGLPVGAQLMAPAGQEGILFQVASFCESVGVMPEKEAINGL